MGKLDSEKESLEKMKKTPPNPFVVKTGFRLLGVQEEKTHEKSEKTGKNPLQMGIQHRTMTGLHHPTQQSTKW